eukprot:TRINITY_DN1366_c0_g1_i2.p1 TRINITY_DN1366_c0_g1~~TRINITY_DN1366_c0_g1_i2.p1  ORF type:complete len:506 (-),score=86.64 TRINITY_DN1366_c0_g1_i2:173-1498(-)
MAEKARVHNLLVITTSKEAADPLEANNIHCYQWKPYEETKFPLNRLVGDFNASLATIHKAHHIGVGIFPLIVKFKHFVASEALAKGYNVLTIDSDILFLKNPFDYFAETFNRTDLWFQQDDYEVEWPVTKQKQLCPNSGFIYARSTPTVVEFYQALMGLMCRELWQDLDQPAFWRALTEFGWWEKLNVTLLPIELFPVRPAYERAVTQKKYLTQEPFIIHFNWMIGLDPKVMTLQEKGWWMINPESYYEGKYVMLHPGQEGWTAREGVNLLVVSSVLKRIPILPSKMLGFLSIKEFKKENDFRTCFFPQDPRFLKGKSFDDLSVWVEITTKKNHSVPEVHKRDEQHLEIIADAEKNRCGISAQEIARLLGSKEIEKIPVLKLKNAGWVFSGFEGAELEKWQENLKITMKHTIWNDGEKRSGLCWWWGKDMMPHWIEDTLEL